MSVQQTSLNAYKEMKDKIGTRQKEVLEEIRRMQNQGKDTTNMELSYSLNREINTITPRVLELRKAGKVELSTKRKCKITGREVMAWKIKQQ